MRYSGSYPPAFWSMDADDSCPILIMARRRDTEEKLFFRWSIWGQGMSFDEFKAELMGRQKDPRTAEEILRSVNETYTAFEHGFAKMEL